MTNEEIQTNTTAGDVHSIAARSINKSRRLVLAVGTAAVISLVAAGAGGGIAAASTTSTTSGPPAAFRPAAFGKIASVTGAILEVQNSETGQTTVNVSSKTVITATVSASAGDVSKGTCISATGTKGTAGSVDATSVALFAATKGQCNRGFGAGGAGGPGGGTFRFRGGTAPGGTTGTRPRTTFKRPANFATASGKVTSKSATKIDVEAVTVTFSKGKATTKTGPKTVNVSKSTKYSKSERVAAGSLKVGECVTATGSTNNIGAVSATTLIVTPTDFVRLPDLRRLWRRVWRAWPRRRGRIMGGHALAKGRRRRFGRRARALSLLVGLPLAGLTGLAPAVLLAAPASAATGGAACTGTIAGVTVYGGSDQTAKVAEGFSSALQAEVVDTGGCPVANVDVEFVTPTSGPSATFPGAATTATVETGSNGVASAPGLTANDVSGSYSVVAEVASTGIEVDFDLTNTTAGVANAVKVTSGNDQSAKVATQFALPLTVTLADAYGDPVPDETVDFTVGTTDGASATFVGGGAIATAQTDESGVATSPALVAGSTVGSYTVTVSVSGVSSSASFTLKNLSSAPTPSPPAPVRPRRRSSAPTSPSPWR